MTSDPSDVSANGALLRRSLLAACQQGHMDVVRLLVHRYGADVQDCNSHNQEFAVISKLPLYAAAQAGKRSPQEGSRLRPAGFLVTGSGLISCLLNMTDRSTPVVA